MAMEEITPKQIFDLRDELGLTQSNFGEKVGVSGSAIYGWEAGNSNPRSKNRDKLIKLFLKTFPAEKSNGKAKSKAKAKPNGNGSPAKGGRSKVASQVVQEGLAPMLGIVSDAVAREAARQAGLDFVPFRRALAVFLYEMGDKPARFIAQALSGHE